MGAISMDASVWLMSSTADASDAGWQAVKAVADGLATRLKETPPFEMIEGVSIALVLSNPAGGARKTKASARFDRKSGKCYARACANYFAWVGGDWPSRIQDVSAASQEAVRAVSATRITPAERERLLQMIAYAARDAIAEVPTQVTPLGPVTIWSDGCIAYDGSGDGRRLHPHEIEDWLAHKPPAKPPVPETFKRYRRSERGLEYREAWPDGDVVIEHWGVCGDRGQSRTHPAATPDEQTRLLDALDKQAQADGFKTIAPSRHKGLEIRRRLGPDEALEALDERHALEELLNEELGWLGLGHCDGGSIGSGSVEVFCLVVDYEIARAAVAKALSGTRFAQYQPVPRSERSR
jgi:hypothetical protein